MKEEKEKPEQTPEEKKAAIEREARTVRVMFGEVRIIDGTAYGKGVYQLEADKARAALQHGGVISQDDLKKLENLENANSNEGKPLSVDETIERFQAGDYSDDVMRSMQYHNTEVQSRLSGAARADYGNSSITEESTMEVSGGASKGFNPSEPLRNEGNEGGSGGNGEGGGNEGGNQTGGNGEGGKDNSDLPEDFPARAELIAGGVETLAKLRGMKRADILALKDIGEAKTNQIGARLAALAEENK